MSDQPNQASYPVSDLFLFPVRVDRGAYLKATGEQAPPFNAALPVKQWEDPAAAGASGTLSYLAFDAGANPPTYRLTVPAASARVNLPGAYTYPAYGAPAFTDATEVGPYGLIWNLSPDQVCLQADAQAIANEVATLFPGQAPTVEQPNTGVYKYVYGQDPRRVWIITVGGHSYTAQVLIAIKNAGGVGAPGHWATPGGTLQWVQEMQVAAAPAGAATLPTPIRALESNEQLVHQPGSPFNQAGSWRVVRTDLQQPAAPATLDSLAASLAQLQAAVDAIAAKVGVSQ